MKEEYANESYLCIDLESFTFINSHQNTQSIEQIPFTVQRILAIRLKFSDEFYHQIIIKLNSLSL